MMVNRDTLLANYKKMKLLTQSDNQQNITQ